MTGNRSAAQRAFCLIFRISRRAAGQRHGPAGSCVFLCSGDLWPRSTRPPGRRRGPGSPSCPAAGRPSGERRAAGELMQGGIIEQRREPGRMRHGQGLQIEPPGRPAALQVHHPPTIAAGQRLTRRPGRRQKRTACRGAAMNKYARSPAGTGLRLAQPYGQGMDNARGAAVMADAKPACQGGFRRLRSGVRAAPAGCAMSPDPCGRRCSSQSGGHAPSMPVSVPSSG